MKKFVSNSIDSCLLQASEYFGCSVDYIDYEIIQNPSAGFLGFGKKEAIIIAYFSNVAKSIQSQHYIRNQYLDPIKIEQVQTNNNDSNELAWSDGFNNKIYNTNSLDIGKYDGDGLENSKIHDSNKDTYILRNNLNNIKYNMPDIKDKQYEYIEDNEYSIDQSNMDICSSNIVLNKHHTESQDNISCNLPASSLYCYDMESNAMIIACQEIKDELVELLGILPLDIDKIEVKPYNTHSVFIIIDGIDSALLIGQKGYRYKSLSYMLFNWINTRYGYGVHLEIAQFLKSQEQAMKSYLKSIILKANEHGFAKTKHLDGVLAYIALRILRQQLPNMYIISHDGDNNEKYITIDSFSNNSRIN
ncbi:Jag N-terminal domain-containing protein [Helicobacter muridarum]|nr:Jag N-terminal domain-containing protein [Helicobacter muridarum]STQ86185.1 VirB11-interacting protein [Helicobacter muridarum]